MVLASVASGALSEDQLKNPYNPTLTNQATSLDMSSVLNQTNDGARSFTAVMTLDVKALSVFTKGGSADEAVATPIISWIVGPGKGHSVNVSINYSSDDVSENISTAGFFVEYEQEATHTNCALPGDSTAATTEFATNGTAAATALSDIDWAKTTDAVLTLTYNGYSANVGSKGVQIYFSARKNDGTITTVTAGTDDLRWTTSGDRWISAIGYEPTYLDSLTIYEGYATAEQADKLNRQALIPEPATATLSLLALAGLALRRRRG